MTATFIVKGHKVRSASQRRFIVVNAREHTVFTAHAICGKHRSWIRVGSGVSADAARAAADENIRIRQIQDVVDIEIIEHAPFANIEFRSDDVEKAKARARKFGDAVVIDTVTGEQV